MKLEDLSTQDLEKELEKRRKAKLHISKKENIDFAPLIELCEEYIEELIMEGSAYSYENKAFETAVECIYGPQVWDWYEENGFG